MRIAVTGATGFIGRYLVDRLIADGHQLQCWCRQGSDRSGLDEFEPNLVWIEGDLGAPDSIDPLISGCNAVVHAALYHPGGGFRGGEGDLIEFADRNLLGTLRLIEAARKSDLRRFVFISTCAVHEKILPDRPLDETHPLWAASHYGAHKGAIEQFVHSYGLGMGFPICALRPTGVYGLARPVEYSKWFDLVRKVVRGESVECHRGGKEVHASDVAKAAALLLTADDVAGEAFNCYDQYVSQYDVAHIAQKISGSLSKISGEQTTPRNQIVTDKIRRLGMTFGGDELLRRTLAKMVETARS